MFKINRRRYGGIMKVLHTIAMLGIAAIFAFMIYVVVTYYMGEDPRCGTTYTCVKVVP